MLMVKIFNLFTVTLCSNLPFSIRTYLVSVCCNIFFPQFVYYIFILYCILYLSNHLVSIPLVSLHYLMNVRTWWFVLCYHFVTDDVFLKLVAAVHIIILYFNICANTFSFIVVYLFSTGFCILLTVPSVVYSLSIIWYNSPPNASFDCVCVYI